MSDLQNDYKVSHRRAASVVLAARSTLVYIPVEKQDEFIRRRIIEIAHARVLYGFWRIHELLRREGWKINHKRTYRIYKEEGLNLRSKRPRRSRAAAHRLESPGLTGIYQCCSMDFMSDQLFDGRKFWIFTLVDNFSRECLALHCGQSLKGKNVVKSIVTMRPEDCVREIKYIL